MSNLNPTFNPIPNPDPNPNPNSNLNPTDPNRDQLWLTIVCQLIGLLISQFICAQL